MSGEKFTFRIFRVGMTSLLLLSCIALQAMTFHISGTVASDSSGTPVPSHTVIIVADSSSPSGFTYTATRQTDTSGNWDCTIPDIPDSTATRFFIRTYDCQDYLHQETITAGWVTAVVDFVICYNPPNNECQAAFTWVTDTASTSTIRFHDSSTPQGFITSWLWNFGDGTPVSNDENPQHNYNVTGWFNVCLTIGTSLGCISDTCIQVYVFIPTFCHAAFSFAVNGEENDFSLSFTDLSTGSPNHFLWNFGDPASGSANTSDQQNPVHSFTSPGTYSVCLIINREDGGIITCTDTVCNTVTLVRHYDIGGHLFAGLFPINNPVAAGDTGIAWLYRISGPSYVLLDSVIFTYLGYYTFPTIPEGNYYIKAGLMPGSTHYSDYTDSWYPGVPVPENADTIVVADSNRYRLDIALVPPLIDKNGQNEPVTGEIFPNPVANDIHLAVSCLKEDDLILEIISPEGRKLLTATRHLLIGVNQVTMPVTTLRGGLYFLVLSTESGGMLKCMKFLK
jgi:PKD repeat protein